MDKLARIYMYLSPAPLALGLGAKYYYAYLFRTGRIDGWGMFGVLKYEVAAYILSWALGATGIVLILIYLSRRKFHPLLLYGTAILAALPGILVLLGMPLF
ncbi:hypothetical protein C4552_01465 [Candidatus Parcubacteria bacterium]|nr:MAG: hypothetical protein C4552_01465 [Candidatus Parcubacteria bacterium]